MNARALTLAGCIALAGCNQDARPLTQLVLVADTDLDALDSVDFQVAAAAPSEKMETATRAIGDEPSYVTLVRDQGPLGTLTVTAIGRAGGVELVRRVHRVSFVENETLVVPLHLLARCRNARCSADQTCSETGCVPQELPASELASWSGEVPTLSAPLVADAGADAQVAEAGTDAQIADAGFRYRWCTDVGWVDVQENDEHCGSCGHRCNGNERCVAGACLRE